MVNLKPQNITPYDTITTQDFFSLPGLLLSDHHLLPAHGQSNRAEHHKQQHHEQERKIYHLPAPGL